MNKFPHDSTAYREAVTRINSALAADEWDGLNQLVALLIAENHGLRERVKFTHDYETLRLLQAAVITRK